MCDVSVPGSCRNRDGSSTAGARPGCAARRGSPSAASTSRPMTAGSTASRPIRPATTPTTTTGSWPAARVRLPMVPARPRFALIERAEGPEAEREAARRAECRVAMERATLVGHAMDRQITPPSITGKGAGFAAGGSVLDHAFGRGEAYTLGVEEEYMLLDSETFDLVQHIDTVLAAVSGHELETRVNAELMQSVLEITTPVCRTAGDVEQELRTLRGYVGSVAREQGLRFGSAGTHPFSLFERQRITAKDRY